MPKQTFLNLPPERREAFKKAAYTLFIERPYDAVGIRDIAEAAGIALGSFYRYFEDKDSMYLDLFCEIEEKLKTHGDAAINPFLIQSSADFKYVLTPLEIQFGETWYRAPDSVLHKYYFGSHSDQMFESFKAIFEAYEAENKLIEGLGASLALYYFKTSYFNLIMYLRQNAITDPEAINAFRLFFSTQVLMRGILTPETWTDLFESAPKPPY